MCFNTSVAEPPIIHAQPIHSTMWGLLTHHTASEPTIHRQWMNLYPASNLYHAAYPTLHSKVQGKAAGYETWELLTSTTAHRWRWKLTILPSSKAFAITTSRYIYHRHCPAFCNGNCDNIFLCLNDWYSPERDLIHRETKRRLVWTLYCIYPLSHHGWMPKQS